MKVLYLPPVSGPELTYLESVLHREIELARPPGSPDGGFIADFNYFLSLPDGVLEDLLNDCDIVVGYRFPAAALRSAYGNGRLKAAIIPFAGIPVSDRELFDSIPDLTVRTCHFNAIPVAEHAVALLLTLAKRIRIHDAALRTGDWRMRYAEEGPNGSVLLHGKKALIVGMGRIGTRIGAMLSVLGMQVTGMKRNAAPEEFERLRTEVPGLTSLRTPEELEALLPDTDVVILCVPGTDETRNLIGAKELALMKGSSLLVNMSRGSVVDESALYTALREERIGGAALDVWWHYPLSKESRNSTPPSQYPFHELETIVMSPHRAGHVAERERLRADALAPILNELREEMA